MRRLLVITLITLVAAAVGSAAAEAKTLFLIKGFGYGHGIGMSQYGAYGRALNGATFDQILAAYYPGTSLKVGETKVVKVLLVSGHRTIELSSAAPYTVVDGSGAEHQLPAGSSLVKRGFAVVTRSGTLKLTGPLRFVAGNEPLEAERRYRGALLVSKAEGSLRLINELPLESYLLGVVPNEMPPSWHPEALKAQAVAARSFALATRRGGDDFDLFADTRSQAYGGIDIERAATTTAVQATSGQALFFGGKVASTFYSSTSGGRTAAIEDVFLGANPVAYLPAVDDPADEISPYHRWGPVVFTSRQLGAQLASPVPRKPVDAVVQLNASGRVELLIVSGRKRQASVAGPTVRTALGLRSSGFSVAVASLRSSTRRVASGGRVTIKGIARGLGDYSLQRLKRNGRWVPVRRLKIDEGGAFTKRFRPRGTLRLRLASPSFTEAGRKPVTLVVRIRP